MVNGNYPRKSSSQNFHRDARIQIFQWTLNQRFSSFLSTVILAVGLLPVPVSLEYKNPLINEINDIYMKIPGGTFDITEKIKGQNNHEKYFMVLQKLTVNSEMRIQYAISSIKVTVRGKLVNQVIEDKKAKLSLNFLNFTLSPRLLVFLQ